MASTGFQAGPVWHWPDQAAQPSQHHDARRRPNTSSSHNMPGWHESDEGPLPAEPNAQAARGTERRRKPRRTYRPRTCRICLETVQPTFHQHPETLPSIFHLEPSVTYDSEQGRLISPCHCKGSSRYVHEECLQTWRHADPSYGARNYWECPTCLYKYRLQRMDWARCLSSALAQIVLTVLIFIVSAFILGFVADPIINVYLDPIGTILPFTREPPDHRHADTADEPDGWSFHFIKGFASLGLLGSIKFYLSTPTRIFRIGGGSWGGSGRAHTGRDRLSNISWTVVVIGIASFIYGVWKFVRGWARRTLEKASERVMDIHQDVDDEDDDDEVPPP